MRNVDTRLLEEKMDEAVTHYINSHPSSEAVHVDANSLALNVQDDSGRVVTVMQHGQAFSTQMTRCHTQVSVGEAVEGPWSEELIEPDLRLAALVAQLSNQARAHHQTHHKISSVRDVDTSVVLDTPLRLFNGQTLESQSEPIVVEVPSLPPLPPLQEMKRCDADWFNKDKTGLNKAPSPLLPPGPAGGEALAQSKASKKSLPHKKRISRKLKRNSAPHNQDMVIINVAEEMPQEEILPDNFVNAVTHQEHLAEDTHHITHEMRPILICQLCGEFYGEEQLKFYHHLKQHYEPHHTIIIENPVPSVPDLAMDKMSNTCIVDNVATLPDSIVELSLENTVPKTVYQSIDKHIMYTTSEKTLYSNKVQYSMASMDKEVPTPEVEKPADDLYESLDKFEQYSCLKCNKQFRKQKQCEAHIREAHSNHKLEDMGEFSEPEDLMAGIHVAVEEGAEPYEQPLLPHLTVDNGHVHQEHGRHWYMRSSSGGSCGEAGAYCPVCPRTEPVALAAAASHLKEEVLQRIFETDVQPEPPFTNGMMEPEIPPDPQPEHGQQSPPDAGKDSSNDAKKKFRPEMYSPYYVDTEVPAQHEPEPPPRETPEETDKSHTQEETDSKKKVKKFECPVCGRIFHHRNSLLYHVLSHGGKQHQCRDCGKGFYTPGALKIHRRVHNGDRPYKCEDCGREFRQWSDLKYHRVSLHSNQKHFKCEFCGKEFARKYSLSVHRRIHTGEKNYKCDYCTKTFRASSYRLSHMRIHTGDRPYKCETCDKAFRVAGDLRRHLLVHEKVRNRYEEHQVKKAKEDQKGNKKTKEDLKDNNKADIEIKPENGTIKEEPNAQTKHQVLKIDKKKKKNQIKKVGAPNVTVTKDSEGQFKINTEYANEFERQDYKYKEVYNDEFKESRKEYDQVYKSEQEREMATLKHLPRAEESKPNLRLSTSKMQVFSHVEKNTLHSVTLNELRALERDREVVHGEPIENAFLERLTALYNIPA